MTQSEIGKICEYIEGRAKPCPFCGDAPYVMVDDFPGAEQFRVVIECCSQMSINIMYSESAKKESKVLIKMWNTRKGCK